MTLNIIVAVAENGVIGRDGKIPWKIPGELKYFKDVTMGYPVVMGRKTYESIGKPLPGRANHVLTRDERFKKSIRNIHGVNAYNTVDTLIEISKYSDVFVIGGSEIFKLFMPNVERVYLTRVHREFPGDTFFELGGDWKLVSETPGPDDVIPHTFQVWERNKTGQRKYPHILRIKPLSDPKPGVELVISNPDISLTMYEVLRDESVMAVVTRSRETNYQVGHHVRCLYKREHFFENDLDRLHKTAYELEYSTNFPAVHLPLLLLAMLKDKHVLSDEDIEKLTAYYERDRRWL